LMWHRLADPQGCTISIILVLWQGYVSRDLPISMIVIGKKKHRHSAMSL
jgi:hypothetical protein